MEYEQIQEIHVLSASQAWPSAGMSITSLSDPISLSIS